MKPHTPYNSEHGSIFIYILIAIALFASLTYTIGRDKGGSSDIFTKEQTKIAAQEMIEYGNTITNAIQKLKLRGCNDNQLDFTNDAYTTHGGGFTFYTTGHNTSAPTSGICSLFGNNGAQINPLILPNNATYDWPAISPANAARGASILGSSEIPGSGQAALEDLILLSPLIRLDVCLKINEFLNVGNPLNAPPTADIVIALYNGSFIDGGAHPFTDFSGTLAGRKAFCAGKVTGNPEDYFFVQVLSER